jgi:hypothetical protein
MQLPRIENLNTALATEIEFDDIDQLGKLLNESSEARKFLTVAINKIKESDASVSMISLVVIRAIITGINAERAEGNIADVTAENAHG